MSKFQTVFLALMSIIACLVFAFVGVLFVTLAPSFGHGSVAAMSNPETGFISTPINNSHSTPFVPPTPTQTPTHIPTQTPQPTATNTRVVPPTATVTPTVQKVSKPQSTPISQSPPKSITLPTTVAPQTVPRNETDFKNYLRSKYSVIAGKNLKIKDISIFNEGGAYPLRAVSIELTTDSALYVFGKQTRVAAREYGKNLLKDTVAYFGGQESSAYVSEIFYTDELLDSYFDDEWYYIGDYDIYDGWYISKDYVQAHYINGYEDIKVWNYR